MSTEGADHAARLFSLQEVGYIYSRLTNPTVAALAERITHLEGGAGGICCSSGHAAQIMALFPLMMPGCNIVASTRLYGGTYTMFDCIHPQFGIGVTFVDPTKPENFAKAIKPNTRAIFVETCANPELKVPDFDAIADALAGQGARLDIRRVHHDPDPTFPNGIPNPLLPENRAGRDPFAYIPFGAGQRICVGLALAKLEGLQVLRAALPRSWLSSGSSAISLRASLCAMAISARRW